MQHYSLQHRHGLLSHFSLVPETPEPIQIHFETARNLYLYGWFVYRFHMVAEQYAFSTLEMALREKLIETGLLMRDAERVPGLSAMLKTAQSNNFISNERFLRRDEWARRLAFDRHRFQEISRMTEEGIAELEVNFSEVEPTTEEINFDWIGHFIKSVPDLRNMHAHGTDALYPNVLWTFEIVSEIINQLFSKENLEIQE